jgi:hypothetical protein
MPSSFFLPQRVEKHTASKASAEQNCDFSHFSEKFFYFERRTKSARTRTEAGSKANRNQTDPGTFRTGDGTDIINTY